MLTSARYILFTGNMKAMLAFYRDTLGIPAKPFKADGNKPPKWVSLDCGSFDLALHSATKPGSSGRNRNKLVLVSKDTAGLRQSLVEKGLKVGLLNKPISNAFELKDPDGNLIQISDH
jgi:catechol 2,3-dioxygenase-like lactoylglutathione lyase family enzyme